MRKGLKVLIACAGVFVLGLVMTVAGYATGGVNGLQKVAEDHDWISTDPAELSITEQEYEFDSIESTGPVDLEIVGARYYKKVLADYDLEDIDAKSGKVIVICDKEKDEPAVKVKDGKLIVEAVPRDDKPAINLNSNYWGPTVIVLCSDKELESIKISSSACDVDLSGVAFKKADIGTNAGDIEAEGITSKGLKIMCDAGDVEVQGDLKGLTEITCEAGDIEVDTADGLATYRMDLHADAGDIEVGEIEIEGVNYTQKGGKDFLKLKTQAGSIEVGNENPSNNGDIDHDDDHDDDDHDDHDDGHADD